jgi:hypothetical protein
MERVLAIFAWEAHVVDEALVGNHISCPPPQGQYVSKFEFGFSRGGRQSHNLADRVCLPFNTV